MEGSDSLAVDPKGYRAFIMVQLAKIFPNTPYFHAMVTNMVDGIIDAAIVRCRSSKGMRPAWSNNSFRIFCTSSANRWISFLAPHGAHYRAVLRRTILEGKCPFQMMKLSIYKTFPGLFTKELRTIQLFHSSTKKPAKEGTIPCPAPKCTKMAYIEAHQIRAGDEELTEFAICPHHKTRLGSEF